MRRGYIAEVVEEIAARAGEDGLVELHPPALRPDDALRIVSGAWRHPPPQSALDARRLDPTSPGRR